MNTPSGAGSRRSSSATKRSASAVLPEPPSPTSAHTPPRRSRHQASSRARSGRSCQQGAAWSRWIASTCATRCDHTPLGYHRAVLELLRDTSPDPAREKERRASSAKAETPRERPILCRACETAVSDVRELFSMRARSPIQVFPNPYGQMKEIMTLRASWSLQLVGEPILEFTWFEGYTWTIAVCAACRSHLGWRYEGSDDPTVFYGLLTAAVREA